MRGVRVGVERVARDVDLVQVGDAGALVARQPHQDLVVLAVRAFPLAGRLAADAARASVAAICVHRDAQVARELAVHHDVERGAGGLEAALDVDGALDRLDLRDDVLRDAVELARCPGPCTKMRIGRFQPMLTSRPATPFRRSRIASSISFCERVRSVRSFRRMLEPRGVLARRSSTMRSISGNSRSAASTCSALRRGVGERRADRRLDAQAGPALVRVAARTRSSRARTARRPKAPASDREGDREHGRCGARAPSAAPRRSARAASP